MTKNEIEKALTSPTLEVRKSLAEDETIRLNASQIRRGMSDKSPLIRYIFARRCLYNTRNKKKLTEKQMKIGLNDSNASVQALFVESNDKISLSDMNSYLGGNSVEVTVAAIKNLKAVITDEQINLILNSNSKRIRDAFVQRPIPFNDSIIDKLSNDSSPSVRKRCSYFDSSSLSYSFDYYLELGMLDRDENVRECFYDGLFSSGYQLKNDKHHRFSYYQLERGLKNGNAKIRESLSNKKFPFYTRKQILRGLKDDSIRVRSSFVNNKYVKLTDKQVFDIFNDDIYEVICAFADRDKPPLTKKQIELGLTSKYSDIRVKFANKHFVNFTDEQIKRGLDDDNEKVVIAFASNPNASKVLEHRKIEQLSTSSDFLARLHIGASNLDLTQEQMNRGLTDKNDYIREVFALRKNVLLTEEQIDHGLTDPNHFIRSIFAKKRNFKPSKKQVDRGIRDPRAIVALSFLERDDITLTMDQVQYLLERGDFMIFIELKKRDEYTTYQACKKTMKP